MNGSYIKLHGESQPPAPPYTYEGGETLLPHSYVELTLITELMKAFHCMNVYF
jgi:hypothetical protein